MTLLPATNSPLLRWTIVALALGCAWVIFRGLELVFLGQLHGLVTATLGLLIGAGLWLRLHAARLFALIVLWFVVFVVPLGMINPFAAMDDYGPNPPNVWILVLQISPWVAGSLFAIHVLDKHKSEFRQWPRAAA